jgi:hypothetical protein
MWEGWHGEEVDWSCLSTTDLRERLLHVWDFRANRQFFSWLHGSTEMDAV